MLGYHSHRRNAAGAPLTVGDGVHLIRSPALRLAVEIGVIELSIVATALLLWGILSSHQWRASLAPSKMVGACVHLGRAGLYCPPASGDVPSNSAIEAKCRFLGRAGRYCDAAAP